ncbi:hypothetical protein HHK36_011558 [Tetracentron sinense]|uniref:Uncharacterized protein n=1 Tax=Tetracentron sinense TaxID=13715 RepID=A0A834Z9N5_TETSI|nr:hypothetical protein HHK36_011558 [Tetracentron sinense]
MAESAVSFVVERFGDLLIHEAFFLHGVSGQVTRMQTEMKRMLCFLKDADAMQERNERDRNWVAEIRDATYDAEDVIDTFILKVASRRRGGFKGVLKRYVCIFNEWIDLHKVGTKMEAIQANIRDITNSLPTYGITSINEGEGTESQKEPRQSYPHVKEEDVIGLEEDIEAFVSELIKEEIRCRVVSIVGMGGLGKTTLAKKVYSHDVITRHFDCTAWAFISQQCRTRDVIHGILKRFVNPDEREIIDKMKEEELVEKLYKFLEEKRYLVVLDDIWSTNTWDRLRPAFPNGKAGSKVLLTTRNKEVAVHADPWNAPHEPRYLTEEESWVLLCNKAFPKNLSTGCPPGFEKFRREIVEKCGGLPLAVVVVGGLLATKMSLNQWEKVLSNISTHLDRGEQRVLGLLALSYNDLPYHLKPCFLYLGMFPEDFAIPVGRLIRLWIAEGFIPQPRQGAGGETMEDVAEQYLVELIHRCMVQIGERGSTREIKTCHVHDLMRDLCLLKAREENFLEICNQGNMEVGDDDSVVVIPSLETAKSRRYVIHFGEQTYDTYLFERGALNLRSLLLFVPPRLTIRLRKKQLKNMYKDFKLLRVLHIGSVIVQGGLPREIGNLIHLRYLRLECIGLMKLPPSIGKLRSLQTLDLQHVQPMVETVPDVIWKMERLRHLYLPASQNNTDLRIDTLRNLQTLKYAKAGSWIEEGHLAKLTNIQKLTIEEISSSEQAEAVLESIVRPDRLLYLALIFLHDQMTFPSLAILSHCHHLSKLYLWGRIREQVPEDHYGFLPPSLSTLSLKWSELEQDWMSTMENLPNLRTLLLDDYSYTGKEMICSTKGFSQLEFLSLQGMDKLEEWRVEEGAMSSLRELMIFECRNLRMVPEGLKFITTLRELKIGRMPHAFEDRVRGGGADYYKVEHIPSIICFSTLPEEDM